MTIDSILQLSGISSGVMLLLHVPVEDIVSVCNLQLCKPTNISCRTDTQKPQAMEIDPGLHYLHPKFASGDK